MERKKNKAFQSEAGMTLEIKFVYASHTVKTTARINKSSEDMRIIELDIDDKKMTLPLGTDIYVSGESMLYRVVDSAKFPEITIQQIDRREYVRIDDMLKIDYKKIQGEEIGGYEDGPEALLTQVFGDTLKIPDTEEVNLRLLYRLVYQTNLKIDRLLRILESGRNEKYISVDNQQVNISGSGMRFKTNQMSALGDTIALRIFLPLPVPVSIHTLGEVVSVQEAEKQNSYYVSVRFVMLHEDDREMIIKYVFQRQREVLRG